MKLTLVRHGESKQNQVLHQSKDPNAIVFKLADPDLTEIGLQQAQYTGKHLATQEPLEIWVSQLTRANQTLAEIKPFVPNAKITCLAELNEKNEQVFGVREREPLQEFAKRVEQFRQTLEQRDRDLVIVGHSMFISVLTSLLLGEPIQDPLIYRNPNCAITRLERKAAWIKHCQGSVDHIPIELRTGHE